MKKFISIRSIKRIISYSIAISSLTAFSNKLSAQNCYISPEGNDNNDGKTISTPKKNFYSAMELLYPDSGDTLFLLPGIYELNEPIFLYPGISMIGVGEDPSITVLKPRDTVSNSSDEFWDVLIDLRQDSPGENLKNNFFINGNQTIRNFTLLGNAQIKKGLISTGRHNVKIVNLHIKDFLEGGIQLAAFELSYLNQYHARKIKGAEIGHCDLKENGMLDPNSDYSYFSNISIGGWLGGSLHHCTIIDTLGNRDGSGIVAMGMEKAKIHDNKIMIDVYETNHWGGIFSVVTGYTAGLEFFNNEVNSGISCENRVPYENMNLPGVPNIMIFNNRFIGTHPNSVGIQAIELYVDYSEIYQNYFENFYHCITSWHGNDTLTNVDIHHNVFRGAKKGFAIHLTMGGTSWSDPANHSVYRNFTITNNVFDQFKFAIYNPHGKTENIRVQNNVFLNLESVWEHSSEEECSNILFDYNLAFHHQNLQNDHSATFNHIITEKDPGFTFTGKLPEEYYSAVGQTSAIIDAGLSIPGFTDGYGGTSPDLGAYEYNGKSPTRLISPALTPPGGKYFGETEIKLTSLNEDAEIYYSLDGSVPGKEHGIKYTGPFVIAEPLTIRAIAVREHMISSVINESDYEICRQRAENVAFSPWGGNYSFPQIINLSSHTAEATIYYTINGRIPNPAIGEIYKGPFYLDSTLNISAIAIAEGVYESVASNEEYLIDFKAPAGGSVFNDTDDAFEYSADYWSHKTERGFGDVRDDIHITYNNGAYVDFYFNGRGIMVITEKNTDKSRSVNFYLDDEYKTTISLFSDKQIIADTVFVLGDLIAGNHKLRMMNTGNTGNMAIDACIVYEESLNISGRKEPGNLFIYPQPSSGSLFIQGLKKGNHLVLISDIKGSMVFKGTYNLASDFLKINNTEISPGIYILQIITEEGRSTNRKIIIE